uniref:39S ribosomal protein L36, mitochondrial n=1 Tax=Meloidogyne incognita TaxID=6306 RepID=A0A914LII3_MELIC
MFIRKKKTKMFVRINRVASVFSSLLNNKHSQHCCFGHPNILIQPNVCSIQQKASLTSKWFLKLHCRYCFFTRRNGRWMVDCTRFSNHKCIQRGFNPKLYW